MEYHKLNNWGIKLLRLLCSFSKYYIKKAQQWHLPGVSFVDVCKNKVVYWFMNKYMKQFVDQDYMDCEAVKKNIDDQKIWVLWLQGEERMPDVVSLCFRQLKRNANGHEVVLLTSDNIGEYLIISSDIMNRLGKSITYAAFSDYLRFNLLTLYGGLWIDSTYFVTCPLDKDIFNQKFWSLHKEFPTSLDSRFAIISKSRWTGNLMYASRNCEYMKQCRNLFCNYWLHYSCSFDYFLIDNCIWYVYIISSEFKNIIDALPISNEYSLFLEKNFNEEWSFEKWQKWMAKTQFFKLTYKGNLQKRVNGCLTNYGYLLDNYL